MARYTAEQLRGHIIRIEGEPGHIQGYHLHIYDETDKQVIDNVKCIGLSMTPDAVNIAHILLHHVDPITKQPVEEGVDVAEAQLEVSFSAQAYDKPPRFVEIDLDGQALAEELRSHRDAWEHQAIQRTLANELRMRQGMSYLVHGEWLPPKDNEQKKG